MSTVTHTLVKFFISAVMLLKGKVCLFDRLPMRDCAVLTEFLDKLAKA